MSNRAYISIGCNLGDCLNNMRNAVLGLYALQQSVGDSESEKNENSFNISSLYGSAAVEVLKPQPQYLNAVVAMSWPLLTQNVDNVQAIKLAKGLLQSMRDIEDNALRIRDEFHGARTLDLDLLLLGKTICCDAEITLPHPGIGRRLFVLQPLCEISPELIIPGAGMVRNLLDKLLSDKQVVKNQAVEIIHPKGWVPLLDV